MSQGQVPADGAPRPKWRASALPAEAAPPASSRGKQLVASLAILLALLGATVLMLQFWGDAAPPYFLSLAIREYGSPVLPVNSLALQDADLLAKRFERGKVERPYNTQTGDGIRRALADLGQKSSTPVVVYLCALARCLGDKVYLLGSDADPDPDHINNDTWVPLSDILRKCANARRGTSCLSWILLGPTPMNASVSSPMIWPPECRRRWRAKTT